MCSQLSISQRNEFTLLLFPDSITAVLQTFQLCLVANINTLLVYGKMIKFKNIILMLVLMSDQLR